MAKRTSDKTPTDADETHRVGEYVADYSQVTPEEIHAPNPELDALLERSKPVARPRKRGK